MGLYTSSIMSESKVDVGTLSIEEQRDKMYNNNTQWNSISKVWGG